MKNINKNVNKNTNKTKKGNTMKKIILSVMIGAALSSNVMAKSNNFQKEEIKGKECSGIIYNKEEKLYRSVVDFKLAFLKGPCEDASLILDSLVYQIKRYNNIRVQNDNQKLNRDQKKELYTFLLMKLADFTLIDADWQIAMIDNKEFLNNEGKILLLQYKNTQSKINLIEKLVLDNLSKKII